MFPEQYCPTFTNFPGAAERDQWKCVVESPDHFEDNGDPIFGLGMGPTKEAAYEAAKRDAIDYARAIGCFG